MTVIEAGWDISRGVVAAIIVTGAPSLLRNVYRMLRYGMKYVDQRAALYQAQHRHSQIRQLKRKAASLGYQLIEVPAA